MKKFWNLFFFIVLVAGLSACNQEEPGDIQSTKDQIAVTGDSFDITESTARLCGWSNQEGVEGASVVYGFEYSSIDLTEGADSWTANEKDSDNKYVVQITGLSSNTLYYYRAYTFYNGVRVYGEVKSFKTAEVSATVTTNEATDITLFEATMNGSLNVDCQSDLLKFVGFIFGESRSEIEEGINRLDDEDYYWSRNILSCPKPSDNGSFAFYLPNTNEYGYDSILNYNTTYYYVAIAKVHDKWFLGEIESFTTKDISDITVTTGDASNIFHSTVTVSGTFALNGNDWKNFNNFPSRQRVGFSYGTSADLSDGKNIWSTVDGTEFNSTLQSLNPNTLYYYCAIAEIKGRIVSKGDIKSFTTRAAAPSVNITTEDASDIKRFAAKIHASFEVQASYEIPANSYEAGFLTCCKENILQNNIAEKSFKFSVRDIQVYDAKKTIVNDYTILNDGRIDADINTGRTETVYYYVPFVVFGDSIYFGEIKSFVSASFFSGQEIQLDGDFADWELLDPARIVTVSSDPDASCTALQLLKVYTNDEFAFVYFEWDTSQVLHGNGEKVPFHCYINTDGSTATGGCADRFSDASIDVMLEGFLYDTNGNMCSYSPKAYTWNGEPNGEGWLWTNFTTSAYGFCAGAGIEGKYEFAISRESISKKVTFADEFSIGFDIQQNWTPVGALPNAAVTNENPHGHANTLTVNWP